MKSKIAIIGIIVLIIAVAGCTGNNENLTKNTDNSSPGNNITFEPV